MNIDPIRTFDSVGHANDDQQLLFDLRAFCVTVAPERYDCHAFRIKPTCTQKDYKLLLCTISESALRQHGMSQGMNFRFFFQRKRT